MNNTQVVTLRMPSELKTRLEREAKYQGVSINQLATYLLNIQVTQLEMISTLESRLQQKSLSGLKRRVRNILKNVPSREVQDWDVIK
ncbi:toxin-antitoxin system HicB family antitoxin [candidate division KSB1 bacterium]|nr:toxin-antitoxin system HicB family antitoxin [candidate division KSB1 bacterium]